jgi:hypothetical protein
MLNQLNIFTNQNTPSSQKISVSELGVKEITKLAEKAKWNDRFYKNYSGGKQRIEIDRLNECQVFVATHKGSELGYIRIHNKTEFFSEFYGGEVCSVCEGYVKPPYRSNGVLTFLRRYVIENHNVKVMRIETERYNKLREYYSEQGFILAYDVDDSGISIICLPEFYDAMWAYNNHHSKH